MRTLVALLLALAASIAEAKTVTVGTSCGGACTYATLQAAITGEVAANPDLTTLAQVLNIELWDYEDTTAASVTGFTNPTASFYVNIYTAASARHAGVWDNTKFRLNVSAASALTVGVAYTRVTGLQIGLAPTLDSQAGILVNSANVIVEKNIVKKTNTAVRNDWGIRVSSSVTGASTYVYIYNNLCYNFVYGSGEVGISLGTGSGTIVYVYSNTVANSLRGVVPSNSRTQVIRNNLLSVTGAAIFGGTGATFTGSGYNSTNLASIGDVYTALTGDRTSQTFTFVNTAGENYGLQASDTGALGLGTTDATPIGYTDDISGATRTNPWSIGAWESDGAPPACTDFSSMGFFGCF